MPVLVVAGLTLLGEVLLFRLPTPADPLHLFGEDGRLEMAQLVLIVGFGVVMALIARRFPAVRPLAVLMAGLALAVFVREHNNHLKEHVGKGAWQALVGVIVVVGFAFAWPSIRRMPGAVLDLLSRAAGGLLTAAVAVFLFAQFFDEPEVWALVLSDRDVPFAVRRVAEEGFELAAYFLAFSAAVWWYLDLRRSNEVVVAA